MKQFDLYVKWYKDLAVKYELIKFLKNRELATLSKHTPQRNTRMLKCHTRQHFEFIWDKIINVEYHKTFYNFYYSLAKYINGIPNQPWRLKDRDNSSWNRSYYKHIEEMDFVIDIDASKEIIDIAYEDAMSIHEFFNLHKVPHEIRFSGRGFHIIIPFKFFQHLNMSFYFMHKQGSYVDLYLVIAEYLEKNYSELVDLTIYDFRRVLKIPYSLAVYPGDQDSYICYPLDQEDLKIPFKIENFTLTEENFKDLTKIIKYRGTYLFNEDGNIEGLLRCIKE